MKTLYIDVYFLINFTIDLLALYFSVIFLSVPTFAFRLIIVSFIGASLAVLAVLLPELVFLEAFLLIILLFCVSYVTASGISFFRRVKLAVVFLLFEIIIGGLVQLLYNAFDKYLTDDFTTVLSEVNNRRLILIAILVLLVIVVLKLVLSVFSSRVIDGITSVEITFFGRTVTVDALCDSGNLVKDPMDNSCVMFVKKRAVRPLFPSVDDIQFDRMTPQALAESENVKRRFRLIPASGVSENKLFVAIKADNVRIKADGRYENVSLTVAIDDEGGTYGGYDGLIPSAVVGNIVSIK